MMNYSSTLSSFIDVVACCCYVVALLFHRWLLRESGFSRCAAGHESHQEGAGAGWLNSLKL